MKRSVHHCLRY